MLTLAQAQLTADERKGIVDTLYIGNLRIEDLSYARSPFNDSYRAPLIDQCIDKPLEGADALMTLHSRAASGGLAAVLRLAEGALSDPLSPLSAPPPVTDDEGLSELPAPIQPMIRSLLGAMIEANSRVRAASANLSPEERRELIEGLSSMALEEPRIKLAFVKKSAYSQAHLLDLLKKVDLPLIRAAASTLAERVERTIPELRKAAADVSEPFAKKLRIAGMIVDIAGKGDDVHDATDAVLTIDLGGNDRYTGRHGAGVGYASVMIDMGGNDTYDVPDLSVGAGILGVGLAYDLGGDDIFRGKSLTFGAGIAGVGALMKEGGDDRYTSVALTQGFGMFGVGLLLDTSGGDRYDAALLSQGAARTQGVGWLVDREGADGYRAGGLIIDAPLFSDVYESFSQGFGMGYREDTGGISGGIGLLTDFGGDDTYSAGTYGQAASYWFSIGSLYDAKGNDNYSGYHYCQASAMHMTAAFLFDLAGDDGYMEKYGAGHAIGHDYGVAFLLDRAGNDVYAARDTRPGTGNANGVGIFLDDAGDDRYMSMGGIGNGARGSGSVGIFADLGGADKYAESLSDGFALMQGTWGVAYDAEAAPAPNNGSGTQTTPPKKIVAGSEPLPATAAMETLYSQATQWRVGTATDSVETSLNHLMAIGYPALQWMVEKKLPTANRLELRAFVAVTNATGEEGRKLIGSRVASKDMNEAGNALRIAIDTNAKEAAPFLPEALKNPVLQRTAALAAGTIGNRDSVPDLMALTAGDDKITALNATVSLAALADQSSLTTAEALLGFSEMPVRKAAQALLAKFPDKAMEVGTRLMTESDEWRVRTGLELLGAVGNAASLNVAGRALTDARPGVKITAMFVLNGRCPQQFRPDLLRLRQDLDPRVTAVAARIDPGR